MTQLKPELLEQWSQLDEDFTREDGPFDIDEVDLEADDVKRLDLGTLIITPFEGMALQLQVEKASGKVQAVMVGDGQSLLEIAVFAGPMRSSMVPEIREEIVTNTVREKGKAAVRPGPYGAEIVRQMPVTDPEGNPAFHVSRTWLVDGPGWVLRGVLMGKAAIKPDQEDIEIALLECFGNLVVRRGTQPAVPGSALSLRVPKKEEQ